jgi:hypothetical protein
VSVVVGFKCDESSRDATEPCGGWDFCEKVVTVTEQGAGYVGTADNARDLQRRLERQEWRFLGGYCFCPEHSK